MRVRRKRTSPRTWVRAAYDEPMEITIGIRQVAREISVETSLSADEVATAVEKALSGSILDLTDTRGRRVVVPSAAIGYIEIGAEEQRRVGFGTV